MDLGIKTQSVGQRIGNSEKNAEGTYFNSMMFNMLASKMAVSYTSLCE